jgi:predicted RNA-binding Zn-ribbon protein involved in translation (DUF1610 family)
MKSLRLGRLDVQISANRLQLTGRIDDAAPLGEVVDQLPAGDITIDTGGVTFINSIGMREWTRLVRAIRARGHAVILERVADVLMTQMNLIGELANAVEVRSFHAQYLCPGCGGEHAPIVEVAPHAQALQSGVAPRMPCPECGDQMELADFPERYLSIFKR